MEWSALYGQSNQPTFENMNEFIGSELWQKINSFLQNTYQILPKITYSKCAGQRGWNVKYAKSGKSLCTLYPMSGYYIALVVIGVKEQAETELLMPMCSDYMQDLFKRTPFSAGGRWLMIHVTDSEVLEDVKRLIQIRMKCK